MFPPSHLSSYGASEAAQLASAVVDSASSAVTGDPADEDAGYQQYLEDYGPALLKLLKGQTPREKVEVLRARIQNLQKLYKSTRNNALRNIYAGQLNKLQAMLRAAKVELAESEETSQTLKATKVISLVGGVMGVGVLVLVGRYLWIAGSAKSRS